MQTWNLFSASDLLTAFVALFGFGVVAVVLKTAFQVNRKG
jgi:hypothetical protein